MRKVSTFFKDAYEIAFICGIILYDVSTLHSLHCLLWAIAVIGAFTALYTTLGTIVLKFLGIACVALIVKVIYVCWKDTREWSK